MVSYCKAQGGVRYNRSCERQKATLLNNSTIAEVRPRVGRFALLSFGGQMTINILGNYPKNVVASDSR